MSNKAYERAKLNLEKAISELLDKAVNNASIPSSEKLEECSVYFNTYKFLTDNYERNIQTLQNEKIKRKFKEDESR